ncbi:hypothetical protein [Singulisphaera sp. GP187]|uniref:hypothetical protein n=1 Tax=Singulisphaera sp. GP187 TaxID=1882752 RepID=UPI0013566370|nr:hypothetical protein [Singulisphaera sp. GP187]
MDLTPKPDPLDQPRRIISGAAMHRPDVRLGELRSLEAVLPVANAKWRRRFD